MISLRSTVIRLQLNVKQLSSTLIKLWPSLNWINLVMTWFVNNIIRFSPSTIRLLQDGLTRLVDLDPLWLDLCPLEPGLNLLWLMYAD